jgi:hypothetical protein
MSDTGGFGLAQEKPEGGSYCLQCDASAGPGEVLVHVAGCEGSLNMPLPAEWRLTSTFKLSFNTYSETPSEAIENLIQALDRAGLEYERIDQINLKQLSEAKPRS